MSERSKRSRHCSEGIAPGSIRIVSVEIITHVDPHEVVLDTVSDYLIELSLRDSFIDSSGHDLSVQAMEFGLKLFEASLTFIGELRELILELLEIDNSGGLILVLQCFPAGLKSFAIGPVGNSDVDWLLGGFIDDVRWGGTIGEWGFEANSLL